MTTHMKEEEDGFEDDVSLSPASPPPVKAEDEDDDKYEDALDLDTSGMNSKVWLVRMPKFLMEQWKDVDDSGRELGKVAIRQGQNDQWKVKMTLNNSPQMSDLPHNYDLTLIHQSVDNTYLFKETELPKKISALHAHNAPSITPSEPRDYTPVVKNVLKKTALVGQAVHECVVTPDFKDPNYPNVLAKRKQMEQTKDPERQVTLLQDTAGVGGLKYGASMRQQRSWLKPQAKKDMYRNGDGKAIRIPKNELLDLLFKLFEEYEYWPLKTLRERTKQPEVYLKEVLDTIAVLYKKGPQANKYGLKPEFKIKGEKVFDEEEEEDDMVEIF